MLSTLPKLILASRSPRRNELLAEAGYDFEVIPADEAVECGVCSRESPAELVSAWRMKKQPMWLAGSAVD